MKNKLQHQQENQDGGSKLSSCGMLAPVATKPATICSFVTEQGVPYWAYASGPDVVFVSESLEVVHILRPGNDDQHITCLAISARCDKLAVGIGHGLYTFSLHVGEPWKIRAESTISIKDFHVPRAVVWRGSPPEEQLLVGILSATASYVSCWKLPERDKSATLKCPRCANLLVTSQRSCRDCLALNAAQPLSADQEYRCKWSKAWVEGLEVDEKVELVRARSGHRNSTSGSGGEGKSRRARRRSSTFHRLGLENIGGHHSGGLEQFRLSQNGRCLAAVDSNYRPNTIFVYTINDPSVCELVHTKPVVSFEFNPTPLKPVLMTMDSQGVVRFWKQREFLAKVGASAPAAAREHARTTNAAAATLGGTDHAEQSRRLAKEGSKLPSDKVLSAHTSPATSPRGARDSVDLSSPISPEPTNESYFSSEESKASQPVAPAESATLSEPAVEKKEVKPLAPAPEEIKSPTKGKNTALNQQSTQWFLAGELHTQSAGQLYVGCAWVTDVASDTFQENPSQKPSARAAKLSSRVVTLDSHGTATMWNVDGLMNDNTIRPEVVYTLHQSLGSGTEMLPQVRSQARVQSISSTGKGLGELCKVSALTQQHALRVWTLSIRQSRTARGDKGEISVSCRLTHSLGGHIRVPQIPFAVESVVCHSSLPFVATLASDRRVVVWKVNSPQIMQPLPCRFLCSFEQVPYYGMAWSPANVSETHMLLFCLGAAVIDVYYFHPDSSGTPHAWDKVCSMPLNCPGTVAGARIQTVRANANECYVVVSCGQHVLVWISHTDLRKFAGVQALAPLKPSHLEWRHQYEMHPLDTTLPLENERIEVIKQANLELTPLRLYEFEVPSAKVTSLALADAVKFHSNSSGCFVMVGQEDGTVTVGEIAIDKITLLTTFRAHVSAVVDLRATSLANFATCSLDGQLKIWEGTSNGYTCVHTFDGKPSTSFDVLTLGDSNMYMLVGTKQRVQLHSRMPEILNITTTSPKKEWIQTLCEIGEGAMPYGRQVDRLTALAPGLPGGFVAVLSPKDVEESLTRSYSIKDVMMPVLTHVRFSEKAVMAFNQHAISLMSPSVLYQYAIAGDLSRVKNAFAHLLECLKSASLNENIPLPLLFAKNSDKMFQSGSKFSEEEIKESEEESSWKTATGFEVLPEPEDLLPIEPKNVPTPAANNTPPVDMLSGGRFGFGNSNTSGGFEDVGNTGGFGGDMLGGGGFGGGSFGSDMLGGGGFGSGNDVLSGGFGGGDMLSGGGFGTGDNSMLSGGSFGTDNFSANNNVTVSQPVLASEFSSGGGELSGYSSSDASLDGSSSPTAPVSAFGGMALDGGFGGGMLSDGGFGGDFGGFGGGNDMLASGGFGIGNDSLNQVGFEVTSPVGGGSSSDASSERSSPAASPMAGASSGSSGNGMLPTNDNMGTGGFDGGEGGGFGSNDMLSGSGFGSSGADMLSSGGFGGGDMLSAGGFGGGDMLSGGFGGGETFGSGGFGGDTKNNNDFSFGANNAPPRASPAAQVNLGVSGFGSNTMNLGVSGFSKGAPFKKVEKVLPPKPKYEPPAALINLTFTPQDAQTLIAQLQEHKEQLFFDERELTQFKALVKTVGDLEEKERALDEFGRRFVLCTALINLLRVKAVKEKAFVIQPEDAKIDENEIEYESDFLPVPRGESGNSMCFAFALHSVAPETLCSLAFGDKKEDLENVSWPKMRDAGIGYWLQNDEILRNLLENLAKSQYKRRKNPNDCMMLYLALNRKQVLLGLMRTSSKQRVFKLLSQDFSQPKWNAKAMTNAFTAMSSSKYEVAIGFFLLAGSLGDALTVCCRNLRDFQLALVLCLLQEGPNSRSARKVLREEILPTALAEGDQWLAHIALFLLNRFTDSLRVLVTQEGVLGFSPVTTSFLELLQCAGDPKHLPLRVPPDLFDLALSKSSVEYGRAGCYLLALEYATVKTKSPQQQFEARLESYVAQSTAMSLLYSRVTGITNEERWRELMQEEPASPRASGLGADITRLTRFGTTFEETSLVRLASSILARKMYHAFFNASYSLDPQLVDLQKLVQNEAFGLNPFLTGDIVALDTKDAKALQFFARTFWSWQQEVKQVVGSPVFLVFSVMVQLSLLLSWIIQRDYYRLLAALQCEFTDTATLLNELRKQELEEHDEEEQLYTARPETTIMGKVKAKFRGVIWRLITFLSIRRFEHKLRTQCAKLHDIYSNSDSFIGEILNALQIHLDLSAALCMSEFKSAVSDVVVESEKVQARNQDKKSEYEEPDSDEEHEDFVVSDVLEPLHTCPQDSNILWAYLELDVSLKLVAKTIAQFAEFEATGPIFRKPIDIFKVQDKQDAPRAVIWNSAEERYAAVASQFGIREINIASILGSRARFPNLMDKHGEPGTVLDDKIFTWQGTKHSATIEESDSLLAPRPLKCFEDLLKESARPGSSLHQEECLIDNYRGGTDEYAQAKKLKQKLLMQKKAFHRKVYEDFTGPGLKQMSELAPVNRNQVCTALAAHPVLPLYVSANTKGEIYLWHFDIPNALYQYSFAHGYDNPHDITSVKFSATGTKLGATSSTGLLALWTFRYHAYAGTEGQQAFELLEAHDKNCADMEFLGGGGSSVATVGDSSDGNNVCIWDSLSSSDDLKVCSFKCHDGGATRVCLLEASNLLVTGGAKGIVSLFNLHTLQLFHQIDLNSTARITALVPDPWADLFYAGTSEGSIMGISYNTFEVKAELKLQKSTFLKQPTFMASMGVSGIAVCAQHLLVSGPDGAVKYIRKKCRLGPA